VRLQLILNFESYIYLNEFYILEEKHKIKNINKSIEM